MLADDVRFPGGGCFLFWCSFLKIIITLQFSSYVFTTLTPVRNMTLLRVPSQENYASQVVDRKIPEKYVSTCIGMEIDREWGTICVWKRVEEGEKTRKCDSEIAA